jgi:membrane dipeptidase
MLSWAAGTRYAGGNGNPGPLTDEGLQLLHAMADYNLMMDISHLWEAAVDRVLDLYPGPIVASHANPRRFVDSPRMLADSAIRRIAERDGVIGAVAFNRHLDALWRVGEPRLPLVKLVEVIDHVCQVTGDARHAGLGSDLDGGFGAESTLAEIDTVADLSKVGDLLAARGYGSEDVRAILGGNWLRAMRATLTAF